ncbi:hypothetical protein PFISCL1PPCAC_25832, partial [Pristionchus fissidentatus]
YGVQIAYRAKKKAIGDDLDKIVNADHQMTHRQLFYNSLAIQFCSPNRNAQWLYAVKDVHSGFMYRASGVLGQLADFKRTFACYEDDLMTFPETSMCPVFSESFA